MRIGAAGRTVSAVPWMSGTALVVLPLTCIAAMFWLFRSIARASRGVQTFNPSGSSWATSDSWTVTKADTGVETREKPNDVALGRSKP